MPVVCDNLRPGGSVPLTTLHFTGWTPPTVASFIWYVLATFAGFKRRVLIVSRGATVNAAADGVTRPSLSVAVTLNAKAPACLRRSS